jgi:hypothetical protein
MCMFYMNVYVRVHVEVAREIIKTALYLHEMPTTAAARACN